MLHFKMPTGMGSDRAARRRWATASAVLAMAAVAGCGTADQPKTEAFEPPAVTASPSPTPTASEADAILAAYREFFARQTEISAAPKEQRRALLEPFTADPALNRVLRGMFAAEQIGEIGYGTPTLDPVVAEVNGDSAKVTDCQDTSETGRKKRKTGAVTTRGLARDNTVTSMKRGTDGSWRVTFVDYLDKGC